MLSRVGGTCGFVDACGITTAAQEIAYGLDKGMYDKCVVEVKKLPMFKMCSGVLVASCDVYDKLGGMMQPLPEELLHALVCESGGVPENTSDWITRGLVCKPGATLNLGTAMGAGTGGCPCG